MTTALALCLKVHLQHKFKYAWIVRPRDRAKGGVAEAGVRRHERRSVCDIERLGAKLGSHVFCDRKSLAQHDVEAPIGRSDDGIARGVSKRELPCLRERRRIEPSSGTALIRWKLRVSHAVRSLNPEAGKGVQVGRLRHGEWTSRLHSTHAGQLPSSCDGVPPSGQIPSVSRSYRNFPDI